MRHCITNKVLFLIVLLLLSTMSLMACEPDLSLKIENQTDVSLTVYIDRRERGSVEPNEGFKVEDITGTLSIHLIEAKNNSGDVIYSKKFKVSELHDSDWRVVISKEDLIQPTVTPTISPTPSM